jgi:DNA repair exonuclease SbcCD ATPase subunit
MKTSVGDITDFYSSHPECIGYINVLTRDGYKTVEYADITAYDSEVYRVVLSNGYTLECSPDHRIMATGLQWIHVKDLRIGDNILTDMGRSEVVFLEKMSFTEDLYDLQVEDFEYYANGIVSHNSTMMDAVTFALFGKPFRNINKPQLINSITNKDLLVELEFTINKNNYLIRRGMKPAIFEVYCNDSLLNQDAEMRDYQDFLERKILRTNYKTFCQVVILGSASFVPFMQLPAGQRRAIIEDLLDLQIFGVMNTLLKSQVQDNQEQISSNLTEQKILQEKIKLLKSHLASIKSKSEQFVKEKQQTIADLEYKIQCLVDAKTISETEADRYVVHLLDMNPTKTKLDELKAIRVKLETRFDTLSKEIDFFEHNDTCPTCKQSIDKSFSCEAIKTKNDAIMELKSGTTKLADVYLNTKNKLTELMEYDTKYRQLLSDASHDALKIKMYQDQIKSLIKEIEDSKTHIQNEATGNVAEFETELNSLSQQYNQLHDDKQVLMTAAAMLKDGGIKTKIVNQYIPIINKLINKYLSDFDLFVEFHLDEQFNEVIKSRHRDIFSYASFSEGEKQRINLSILFSWRAVAKLRNSLNTNLLILDEIADGAVDVDGLDNLQKVLNTFDSNTSIFVISHREGLNDKFNNTLRFVKHKNFSRLETI